ncbi:MAG: DUF1566 domain-containing protein [Treponema sp.]|nr:DUF1566 domain-containing protein [Treponema sp.]
MKKTKFIGFLAIFTLISLTMIACDADECAHIWGRDVITEPTCTTGGFTTQTCSMCLGRRQINPTSASATHHIWGRGEITEPTCSADGFTTQTCTMCPETRQIDPTSATGEHIWGNDVVTPPTCLDGFTTQTCISCPETRQITPTTAVRTPNWDWATHTAGSGLRECQYPGCTATAGIGDIGPEGGVIFYVREAGFTFFQDAADTTGATRHYLEASPANLGDFSWAISFVLIPGLSQNADDPTDWAIGRGMKNTEIIIAHGIANSHTTGAATAARGLGADWFLPSRNELDALFQNRAAVGNLGTPWFWSSSQGSPHHAWGQNFPNGSQSASGKNGFGAVRAVRAF